MHNSMAIINSAHVHIRPTILNLCYPNLSLLVGTFYGFRTIPGGLYLWCYHATQSKVNLKHTPVTSGEKLTVINRKWFSQRDGGTGGYHLQFLSNEVGPISTLPVRPQRLQHSFRWHIINIAV